MSGAYCLVLCEKGEEKIWFQTNNTFHADQESKKLLANGYIEVMRFIADQVETTRIIKFKFREQK